VGYNRIFWKDRVLVLNNDGTINKIIQEGTPVSAFNLNHMDEGINKVYHDTDLIKKNQLELLTSRDLEGQRITMDEGYWFDSLKNESKVKAKNNISIKENSLGLVEGELNGEIEFNTHEIGFKTNKTTYFHKRKLSYATLQSATNKTTEDNSVDVISEIITISY
jgi:hypothetical protein